MPHHSRNSMRQAAKIVRELGETVWLLTRPLNTSRSTPFSIVDQDAPDPTTITKTQIYAVVQWNTDSVSYDEVGHAHNLSASVTATIQYMPAMQKCFAVQFSDGTILRKTDEALSPERTSYAVHVEGEANVVNN